MRYITAQPDGLSFYWQLLVQVENFRRVGIDLRDVHILIGITGAPSRQMLSLSETSGAQVFFYSHSGDYRYLPSIQFHLLAEHYKALPELQHEYVFLLDSDVIFSRLPDYGSFTWDGTWYVSQTWVHSPESCYLNSLYLRRHSETAFREMAEVVGLAPARIIENDPACGGAQYVLTGVDENFWRKVEMDSKALYVWYRQREAEYKVSNQSCDVQIWCAGMWAILWNAWLFSRRTVVHPELAFAWATYRMSDWQTYPLLHMAGVFPALQETEPGPHFDKTAYRDRVPFGDDFGWINPESITNQYVSLFKSVQCS